MNTFKATPLLIAIAATMSMGVAHAQSKLQFRGTIDVSAGVFQASGAEKQTRMDSGRMTTSYWGLLGEEDLGNGLKAGFELGQFVRVTNGAIGRFDGDTQFSRGAYLYLAGGFGRVELGRQATPLYLTTLQYNPFGASFGFSPAILSYFADDRGHPGANGMRRRMVEGDTSWNSSLSYVSPSFGGFRLRAQTTLNDGANGQGGENLGAAVFYDRGALSLALTGARIKAEPLTAGKQEVWQLNGAYDFTVAKLFAQYGEVKSNALTGSFPAAGSLANTHGKLWQLGASVPVGPAGKFMASYGYSESKARQDGAAPNSDRSITTIGYDHFLSKRTDLYTIYMLDKLKHEKSGNTYVVGIRHAF